MFAKIRGPLSFFVCYWCLLKRELNAVTLEFELSNLCSLQHCHGRHSQRERSYEATERYIHSLRAEACQKDTRVLQPQIPAKRSGDSNLAKSKTMIQGGICRNKSAPGFSAIFTISPYSDPYNIGQLYKPRHPATAATCTPFQHDSRYPPIHTTAPETIFGPEIPTHWNRACSLSE